VLNKLVWLLIVLFLVEVFVFIFVVLRLQ